MSWHAAVDMLAWLAAIVAGWAMFRWRLRGLVIRTAERVEGRYFIALVSGSLIGAYLFGSLNLLLSGQPGMGRSVLGSLCGAIAFVEIYKKRKGLVGSTGVVFVVPLCVALIIGRLGCLFAGMDDYTYGTPSALPWAWDFGDDIGRHPVALYEALAMLGFLMMFFFAVQRSSASALRDGFYLCVAWYALQRFGWEFLKPYGTLIGPLNLFHFLCLALLAYSVYMMRVNRRVTAQRNALSV